MSEHEEITVKFWGVRGSHPTPGPDTVCFGGNTPVNIRPKVIHRFSAKVCHEFSARRATQSSGKLLKWPGQ